MASPSKEENVLKIILENSPLKEWHFEEIARDARVTKLVANKWLRKYVKEGLIEKIIYHDIPKLFKINVIIKYEAGERLETICRA